MRHAACPILLRARDRALEMGKTELARHYHAKYEEELGHEAWAQNDLRALSESFNLDGEPRVLETVRSLVEHLENQVEEDPTLYLTYIVFTEYVTVLLGPELLKMCEERCGIARSSLTVVDHHVHLDIEHAEEQLQHIDEVVDDPRYLEPIRNALRTTMDYHWRFLRDIDTMPLEDMYEHPPATGERQGGRPSDRPAA
jgi:hypothetical protein